MTYYLRKYSLKSLILGLSIIALNQAMASSLYERQDVLEDQSIKILPTKRLILSLDGGGIRGILEATILTHLEEVLEAEINNRYPYAPASDIRLGECFDLIAGTSTGGIIAVLMRAIDSQTHRPQFKMNEILNLYRKKGHIIFPEDKSFFKGLFSSKYSPEALEGLLKHYAGEQTLKDLKQPVLITTYDIHQEGLYLFKSYESHKKSQNYKLKDLLRATSAAPTYFPAAQIKSEDQTSHTYIDGGVSANNPTLHAYYEAQKLYPESAFDVISLGTGTAHLFTLDSIQDGGKLQWASDISSVLMNSNSRLIEELVSQATSLRKDTYIRLQLDVDKRISELDKADIRNIKYLHGRIKEEISKDQSPLTKIKQTLLDFYASHQFYIFYPLIQSIKEQLRQTPHSIKLINQFLTERGLWEVNHFILSSNLHVKSLDLSHNNLLASHLTHLNGFENLEELNLDHTDLTIEGLQVIKRHGLPLKVLSAIYAPSLESIEDISLLVHLIENYETIHLNAPILLKIGHYYEEKEEFEKAKKIYKQNKKSSLLQVSLAKLYLRDDTDAVDFEKGFQILTYFAEKEGCKEAQYTLGYFYDRPSPDILNYMLQNGYIKANQDNRQDIKKQSLSQVEKWYKLAAAQHHKSAARELGRFYENQTLTVPIMPGQPCDERHQLQAALKYYTIAQKAGATTVGKNIDSINGKLEKFQ